MATRLIAAVCATALIPVALLGTSPARASETTTTASCAVPAQVVSDWVGAWKAKNFKRMVALSQISWRLRTPNGIQTLRDMYGFKDVVSYRVLTCRANPMFGLDITFRVKYRFIGLKQVQIDARVIQEDASGYPSASGHWGVNPISTLREEP